MSDRNSATVFVVFSLLLIFVILGYTIHKAYSAQTEFAVKCRSLRGEVVQQRGQFVCVDPRHILLTQSPTKGHKITVTKKEEPR